MDIKAKILAADDLEIVDFDVPEWGVVLKLKPLPLGVVQKMNDKNAVASMLVNSIVNEDGSNMFTMSEFAELKNKSAMVLKKITDEINKINGFSDDSGES